MAVTELEQAIGELRVEMLEHLLDLAYRISTVLEAEPKDKKRNEMLGDDWEREHIQRLIGEYRGEAKLLRKQLGLKETKHYD